MEIRDSKLRRVADRLASGERLAQADGEVLFATRDLHALGALADAERRRRHGRRTYYNVNRHINYTNVCVLACRFCRFRHSPGDPAGTEMTPEEVAAVAAQTADAGGTEVHITGGLHPTWRIEYYEEMLRAIRAAAPAIHIKAFTAVEIAHVAALSALSVEQVLRRLIDAGLDSLPGGGAEIFDPEVHEAAFRHKIPAEEWFSVHATAHRLGLRSTATMLYGHVETPGQRVAHMLTLREAQDATGGFQAFVPLSFQPEGTALGHLRGPTGRDDLRTIATARLLLDNIEHVKTFWVMHTLKLSQLALHYGADDVDGTVRRYEITTRDGSTRQEVTVERMRRVIEEAGLEPIERDSLYRPVV